MSTQSASTGPATASGSPISMPILIHAGIELIAMIGVAFWLNSKISALQTHLTTLEDKIKGYDAIFQKQGEIITHHENALRQIFSMLNGGQSSGQGGQTASQNNKNNTKQKVGKPPPNKSKTQPKQQSKIQKNNKSDEEEDEDEEDDDLDELIQDELREMVCDVDGECEEIISPSLKKKSTTSTTSTKTRVK